MEVKPGYKQTEVGVIPEEWNVEPLGELSDFVTSGSRGWAQFYSESGALFIRSQNVRDGRLSFEDVQYVSPPTGAEGNRTKVKPNDLLITITGNSVGNVALVEQAFDEAYISQHVGLVRLKEPTSGAYICRYLSPNSPGNRQIAGSQSGQSKPGLNLQNLKDFRIALPPTPSELHAIAEALSDVDGLLGGLDRLIAKKRDLKQAAMQQLLTGQTRLPGFHGEWEVKKIGEFTDCTAGGTPSTQVPAYWGGTIRWMNSGELNLKRVKEVEGRITEAGLRNSSTKLIPKMCVLIGLAGQGKTRGTVAMNFVELCTNQSIAAVFPNPAFVPEYLYFNLDSRYDELRELSAGDGGRGGLNLKIIKAIPIPFPSVPEQTAIASVLTEMDGELAALEQRREKTRALKQAMMQELLTGRTRLV